MRNVPNGNDASEKLLLKPNEAADLLAISPRTIWELKKNGKIRPMP
jgi:hypothetical protein